MLESSPDDTEKTVADAISVLASYRSRVDDDSFRNEVDHLIQLLKDFQKETLAPLSGVLKTAGEELKAKVSLDVIGQSFRVSWKFPRRIVIEGVFSDRGHQIAIQSGGFFRSASATQYLTAVEDQVDFKLQELPKMVAKYRIAWGILQERIQVFANIYHLQDLGR